MAIVGLAAGTAARQATAVYGPIPIDGYELDPKIVEVGQKYFGENLPNLNVHIGDGRWNLEQSPHQYDIIAVDAYRPPYIPPHMTTREFYPDLLRPPNRARRAGHQCRQRTGRSPPDRRAGHDHGHCFPSIHIMDIPGTLNTMIFATKRPTSSANSPQTCRSSPASRTFTPCCSPPCKRRLRISRLDTKRPRSSPTIARRSNGSSTIWSSAFLERPARGIAAITPTAAKPGEHQREVDTR